MHRLLCTALLLLCCVYGCIATDVVQTLPQKGQGPWDAYTVAVSVPDPGAALEEKKRGFKPIRFAVSAKEIDRVLSYCKRLRNDSLAENEDDEISGFKLEIEEKLCVMSTRITPERRKTLLREVLPAALKLHSERLSVEHVEGTLNLSFNGSPPFLTDCPHASIPKKHLKGISDADFMLYVGVTESYKPVQICSKNTKGRPTSALIRFIPKEIDATRHFIRYAAHEIAHALGFEIETMKKHNIIKEEKSDRKTVRLVTSKTVLEKMKDQYGCLNEDEIKKVAFENDLPEGAPLHWERRIAKDELMSKYTIDLDVTGAYYSTLTLAIFDSMPFYSANFKMAESMSWGKDAGCKFLKGELTEKGAIITNHTDMFCTELKEILQCTSNRFALGRCAKGMTLEERQNIFPMYAYFNDRTSSHSGIYDLTDGYPFIKPIYTTGCESGNETLMPGSIVGKTSRCLKGEKLKLRKSNQFGLTVGDICAEVKCGDNEVMVRYRDSVQWHKCSDAGRIDVENSSVFDLGSILCPKYSEVCTDVGSPTNFPIVYDEGEEKRIKEDEEQEKREMEEERKKASTNTPEAQQKTEVKDTHSDSVKQRNDGSAKGVEPTAPAVAETQRNADGQSVLPSASATDPTTAPQLPLGEKEHQDHNGNSSNNNSGTSSKNVNTANVAATVKGPNDTQMGQVMNEVGVIAGGGNDSSIAASYQFPLLLLVFAMVAVASP